MGGRVVELDLIDESRSTPAIGDVAGAPFRRLPTTLYLPAADDAAPLIVLAHGFNGHPRRFSALARHWAAAGYVVAVPRFPVSNDEFAVGDLEVYSDRIADLPGQADDVTFVIGQLVAANDEPTSVLTGRLDPERLGLYGLSMGALTVWSTVARNGMSSSGASALIQSDGGFPGDLATLRDVPFPVLIAHSDADPLFPVDNLVRQFDALPSPRFLLVLHGAAHAAVGENAAATAANDAYRVATTVFWDRYLGGAPERDFPESLSIEGVTTFVDGS